MPSGKVQEDGEVRERGVGRLWDVRWRVWVCGYENGWNRQKKS
jgi:hypothetical protein